MILSLINLKLSEEDRGKIQQLNFEDVFEGCNQAKFKFSVSF